MGSYCLMEFLFDVMEELKKVGSGDDYITL